MRFINYIKSKLFKKELEPEEENQIDYSKELASLSVTIKKDLSLEILCEWDGDEESPDLSLSLGTMLQFLTNGGYDFLISDALIKTDSDPKFINDILTSWKSNNFQEMKEKLLSGPLVSPLRTFGESNIGLQP